MTEIELRSNPEVKLVFDTYPEKVKTKLLNLRIIILETATELEEIESLEETLKWGEPSYISKTGSTIRIDWKEKKPEI
jgi:hypothetical protein